MAALASFLDISGAFDNLDIDAAVRGMTKKKLPPFMVSWYAHYLRRRTVTTTIKSITRQRYLTRGTPQGGVLSPLVWNIAFDELLDLFNTGPVKIVGFADDAALVITGIDPHGMAQTLEHAIKKATDWGQANQLSLAAEKTVIVLFHRKKKPVEPDPVRVLGVPVPYQEHARYLGVILDKGLKFTEHIKNQVKRAKQVLNKIRGAIGKLWGPTPNLMKWVYTGMIRPMLTYGALIWAFRATATHFVMLTKVQRLAMLALTFVKRSTPTLGLEIAYGIEPINIYAKAIAVMAMERVNIRNTITWDGIAKNGRGHVRLAETHKLSLGLGDVTYIPPESTSNFERKFRVDLDSFKHGEAPHPGVNWGVQVYTDGSKLEGKTGWGVHIVGLGGDEALDNKGQLQPGTSVFQAELTAITMAANMLLDQEFDQATFFVDSQAALLAINKPFTESKEATQCASALQTLSEKHRITLNWIKAHVGHEGNEEVDDLAKQGTTADPTEDDPAVSLPPSFYKLRLREEMFKEWDQRWQQTMQMQKTCRQTRLFLPHPDKSYSKLLLQLNRDKLSLVLQALTGHNNLNYHQHNIGKQDSPMCRICGTHREESWLTLTQCPGLDKTRQETAIYSTEQVKSLSFQQLLALLSVDRIGKLFKHRED